MVETINKLIRVSRQLLQELGREPTPEEIAEEMHMSVERVREILKISQEPVSLETPIGEEEDSHLGDFIQDDNVPVPADAAAFTMLKEQLEDVLSTLTDREQKVLRLRFGLDDGRARTLEELVKSSTLQESVSVRLRRKRFESSAIRVVPENSKIIWTKFSVRRKDMQLSKRLSAVAEFVTPGGCLVDVGTDHGYVPIALLEQKKISSAIAMDVNRGPLERAREHITQYNMGDYIETRLSDGLHALQAGEGDSLLIAGMGGGLTVRILSEGEPLLSGFGELILEPQSDIDRVRAWLLEHGFYLAQENFVEEDGKYYPILRAVHGEKEDLKAEELFYGPRLLENQNPVLLEYLQKQQNQNRMLIGQLSGNPGEKATQRLCELKEKEAILESALARFHTM